MALLGGFRIGRWFGFEIRIDYSWFLVFALVVWTFSGEFARQLPGRGEATYYAMSVVGGLVFFLSVLLHELAHSAVARARGIEVEGITLFIFGGIARTRMEAERAMDEFLLTIVGPLSSLGLAGVFWGLAEVASALGLPDTVAVVSSFLALLNLVLAVFNMLPGFPLDGGRIFRSVVWGLTGDLERATRWATWGGRLLGYLLIGFGIFELIEGFLLPGLWSAFIGWFLSNAASASYRQFRVRRTLSRVPVWRVMAPEPLAVTPDMSVEELVEGYFMRRPESAYPVVRNGAVLEVVAVDDVREVDAARRADTRVGEVMRGLSEVAVADRDEPLDKLVARLRPSDEERVLVVEGGRLVGVLSLGDVGRWVERFDALGTE